LLLEALGGRDDFRDALLGDLAEEFAARAERDGVGAARRWYRREAVRAAPHLLRHWVRHARASDVAYFTRVALVSFLVVGIFVLVTGTVLAAALGALPDVLHGSFAPGDALHDNRVLGAVGLVLATMLATAGGYVAARLGARAPLASALTLGLLWACVSAVAQVLAAGAPVWYRVGVPLVVVVGTAVGGVWRVLGARAAATG
jgi:hypothetical protein